MDWCIFMSLKCMFSVNVKLSSIKSHQWASGPAYFYLPLCSEMIQSTRSVENRTASVEENTSSSRHPMC